MSLKGHWGSVRDISTMGVTKLMQSIMDQTAMTYTKTLSSIIIASNDKT